MTNLRNRVSSTHYVHFKELLQVGNLGIAVIIFSGPLEGVSDWWGQSRVVICVLGRGLRDGAFPLRNVAMIKDTIHIAIFYVNCCSHNFSFFSGKST